MKNKSSKANSGSVLVAALIFALAIATTLVSYLWLVQNSDQTVARAQRWNSALAVAEAGIEEGMANLNQQGFSTTSNTVTFNPFSHSLTIATYRGTYNVSDAASSVTNNIITSAGVVTAPITGNTITRTVRVTAFRQGLFSKGIVAMKFIDLSGDGGSKNEILVDSYDSRLGTYNVNSRLYYGGVAVMNGDLDLANHIIGGDIFLGPNSSISGNNGSVMGITNYGWVMQYPDASLPTKDANGNALPSIWPDAPGTPITHTFTTSGYYTIRDTGNLIVNPGVTVTLDVKVTNYDFSKNNDIISIGGGTTNSGTLTIYQESGTATFGGQDSGGAINSQPKNFSYFGLPGVTRIDLAGGSTVFSGVIYAPEADMTLNGGGATINLMGAFVVNSLTDKGHYLIHYDQSLSGYYYGYYVAGSWQEL